jgi:regulator of protease activity HflC (stomatin/prohibitin superfamily)
VIERLGRYSKTLTPGFHLLIPILDRDAYRHSLKEEAHEIMTQSAITKDNVTIHIDGVLYLRIFDPYKASYGVSDPLLAMKQLAMTTMRSEIGKLTLDKTFEERENLNHNIVNSINSSSEEWGIHCMRYEIKDIVPPTNIRKAMELQAESERQKRADILTSEGRR